MAGRQAKILTDKQVQWCLRWVEDHRRYPHRDKVAVLLSFKAGLRAMEIAKLRRWHVMSAGGDIDQFIHLENKIAKKGSGRIIPMNQELRSAVVDLFAKVPGHRDDPLILSERSMRDPTADLPLCMEPKSICYFFYRLYRELSLVGCSSHSGRRTFITKAAKNATAAGASLRDVQRMAGHSSLTTTQRYIEADTEAQRKLVDMI